MDLIDTALATLALVPLVTFIAGTPLLLIATTDG